ncbi:hypothetical protein NSERUTF1_0989 [Nocardia seriolae]|nr:hypothetical protein NSERUTF1_0989 [Nocardia seriolae]
MLAPTLIQRSEEHLNPRPGVCPGTPIWARPAVWLHWTGCLRELCPALRPRTHSG